MWISVGLNLGYLGFFKYCDFFVGSAHAALAALGLHVELPVLQIVLPVGISFYTFQSISYIVDVYRESREHTDDLVAFALFLAYFPHLVAGPIQRGTQLLPQLLAPRRVTQDQIERGACADPGGVVQEAGHRRRRGPHGQRAVRRPGRAPAPRAPARDVPVRRPDLLRLLRLHRHRPRREPAASASSCGSTSTSPTCRPTSPTSGAAGTSRCRTGCATTSTSRWAATAAAPGRRTGT